MVDNARSLRGQFWHCVLPPKKRSWIEGLGQFRLGGRLLSVEAPDEVYAKEALPDLLIRTGIEIAVGLGPETQDVQHPQMFTAYEPSVVTVVNDHGRRRKVLTYFATPDYIDDSLKPYSWYKDFVLAGCLEHQLPNG